MQKKEFIRLLRMELDFLSKEEREEAIHYYDELISDAVDNGENEERFIESLGSIAQIALNVRNDRGYIEKEKTKQAINVKEVVSVTTKIITYAIFILVSFIGANILFGFSAAAIGIFTTALINIIRAETPDTIFFISRTAMMLVSVGMILIVIGCINAYIKHAKKWLSEVMNTFKGLFNKGGVKHE